MGYPDWWPDTKKRRAKITGRFSNQHRIGRAAVGLSVEEKTDENKEGAAMNNTAGNRGTKTQSLSYRDLGFGREEGDGLYDPSQEGYGDPLKREKGYVEP